MFYICSENKNCMQNLYQINVKHLAPKDSHESIECFIIAENEDQVFDYLAKEKAYWTESETFCENHIPDFDEDQELSEEEYSNEIKKFVISTKGEIDADWACYDDLYYGQTHWGWELKKENISIEEVNTLKNLGLITEIN